MPHNQQAIPHVAGNHSCNRPRQTLVRRPKALRWARCFGAALWPARAERIWCWQPIKYAPNHQKITIGGINHPQMIDLLLASPQSTCHQVKIREDRALAYLSRLKCVQMCIITHNRSQKNISNLTNYSFNGMQAKMRQWWEKGPAQSTEVPRDEQQPPQVLFSVFIQGSFGNYIIVNCKHNQYHIAAAHFLFSGRCELPPLFFFRYQFCLLKPPKCVVFFFFFQKIKCKDTVWCWMRHLPPFHKVNSSK